MVRTGFDDYNPLEWKQEFSSGSQEIDNQRKKLLTFYNDALTHCSGDRKKEREYFDGNIDAFINLLEEHFDMEEQILSARKYPKIDGHILDHLKLLEKVNLVKEETRNNNWKLYLHIFAITLKDWLAYHYHSYDSEAREYFRENDGVQPEMKRQAVSA